MIEHARTASKISLVLADVDGTLLTTDKVLTSRAADGCEGARRRRHRLCDHQRQAAARHGDVDRSVGSADADCRLQRRRLCPSRPLGDREPHARSGDRQESRGSHPRSGAGRLGLHGGRMADPQSGRAACGARGLDGEVRRQGRAGVHRRAPRARGEDRRHLRRSRSGRRLREAGAESAGRKGERGAFAALLSRRDPPAGQQGRGRRAPCPSF